MKTPYLIPPHGRFKLSKVPTDSTGNYKDQDDAVAQTKQNTKKLAQQQELLAANASRAMLIVLQAMDAGGKDGTISHIFTGVNPQGCDVTQFKVPTPLERKHDFLWRVHQHVPEKGKIGIFNRSHYEDVLVPRAHGMIGKKELKRRYAEIVEFEKMLHENGTLVLKFFLHISREEQTKRLRERMTERDKQWKLSESDFAERPYWDEYQAAYGEAITATTRKHAPWFVIPADYKWYRNVVISGILVDTLEALKLKIPKPSVDLSKIKL